MEIGRIAEMDQAKVNHTQKIEKVQETDEKSRIVPNEQYKNTKPNEIIKEPNEVILDNVRFGYNKDSQDFFVKVTKNNIEYKYPTEDMMKMKAQLLAAMQQQEN
jgi:uncharacterized FlaG/YvyC family protein